jgi:hypothetical protein
MLLILFFSLIDRHKTQDIEELTSQFRRKEHNSEMTIQKLLRVRVMVFNDTFNNISVLS